MSEAESLIPLHNNSGNVVGYKVREDINNRIDILRVVNILLFDEENRIFITKPKDDLWKGKWASSAAGLVRKDESAVETAIRTLRKELNIEPEDLMFVEEKYYDLNRIKRIISIFYARTNSEPIINREEILNGTWINVEEIRLMIKKEMFNPAFLASFNSIKDIIY